MRPRRPYMHKTSLPEERAIDGSVVALPKRVHDKIKASEGHWLWVGTQDGGGYGLVYWNKRQVRAHRFVYEQLIGPIPEGLHMDHLCRVRNCVNPAHLEPVSQQINTLRGISPAANATRTNHCKRGHEFTPENTITRPNNMRLCWACCRIRSHNRKVREREARHARGLKPDAPALKRAQTHCKYGHEFSLENTRITPQGYRACRECSRIAGKKTTEERRKRNAGN